MMSNHAARHFSVTIFTEDEAVLSMLRGLSYFSESAPHPQIASGGTGKGDWKNTGHQATFRFSSPECRSNFQKDAGRLLPALSWTLIGINDNDPATPRGQKT